MNICIYCKKEIKEDEPKYHSKQASMEGLYHWKCFVEAVKINHLRNVYTEDIDSPSSSLSYYK